MDRLEDSLLQLITETATNLPADVRRALKKANHKETNGTQAKQALSIISLNVDMAKDNVSPIVPRIMSSHTHTTSVTNRISVRAR